MSDNSISYEFRLPRRDDLYYMEMETFSNIEMRNNIAFELLIRTDEYKELKTLSREERKVKAQQLGFTEEDSDYAGLPMGLFRLLTQKMEYNKHGLAYNKKDYFESLLIDIAENDNYENLSKIINIFDYYLQNKQGSFDDLNSISRDIESILNNVVVGYYCIINRYIDEYTFEDHTTFYKKAKNDFIKLVKYYVEGGRKLINQSISNDLINFSRETISGFRLAKDFILDDIINGYDKLLNYCIDNKKIYTLDGKYVEEDINVLLDLKKFIYFVQFRNKDQIEDFLLLLCFPSQKKFLKYHRNDLLIKNCKKKLETDMLKKYISVNLKNVKLSIDIKNDFNNFCFIDKILLLTMFDSNIPLKDIENFVSELNIYNINKTKETFRLEYKRPKLIFKKTRLSNIEIDMNLLEKEFYAYIKKLKKEYDKNNSIKKNNFEIINKNNEIVDIINVKIKSVADKFFVYDYVSARNLHIEYLNSFSLDKNNKEDIYSKPKVNTDIEKDSIFNEKEFKQSNIKMFSAKKYYYEIKNNLNLKYIE